MPDPPLIATTLRAALHWRDIPRRAQFRCWLAGDLTGTLPASRHREVQPSDYSYSFYDALVSINVASGKARAVVDAMERDMGTNLATKADLQVLRTSVEQEFRLVRKEMELPGNTITVRLGSVMVLGLGLGALFAPLKLT